MHSSTSSCIHAMQYTMGLVGKTLQGHELTAKCNGGNSGGVQKSNQGARTDSAETRTTDGR